MIVPIFCFAYNKQIVVCFERKLSIFVGEMQSFHFENFVFWTGLKVADSVNFLEENTNV